MLQFGVITLFPELIDAMKTGVLKRALDQNIARIDCWNPRQWATNAARQVDDRPYGGGPGMVLMYEPLRAAIAHAKANMPDGTRVVYLSPQGKTIQQADINRLAKTEQHTLFLAGRYEGVDERIIASQVDEEWSLGNFVLSGGELAAMAFMDATIRLLPGALGHEGSAQEDSFMNGLLDHPHFTRPVMTQDGEVPPVLLSGNHENIRRWRHKQALGKTWLNRKDLLDKYPLTKGDEQLLAEFLAEHGEIN